MIAAAAKGVPLWPVSLARGVDVVGLGEICLDEVAIARRLPEPAGKAEMLEWRTEAGGQVATAVLAARRLGRSAAFIGAVGDDDAGVRVRTPLADAGVDLSAVRVLPGVSSQRAMIWIDEASGERTILSHRPKELALPAASVPVTLVARAGVLLVDGGHPEAACAAAEAAREAGVPVVLDADQTAAEPEAMLRRCDFPILPEDLARALYGSPEAALETLGAGGARLAVVTLGEGGAIAAGTAAASPIHSPALSITAVDTTGAGDAFHGAFCDAVLAGHDAAVTLQRANVAAGLNCLAVGAQGGLPTAAQLESALARAER